MGRKQIFSVLAAVLSSAFCTVDAFHQAVHHRHTCTRSIQLSAADNDDNDEKRSGITTLKFIGSATTSTDTVPLCPLPSSEKSLLAFFCVDANRDILMEGTGNKVEPMEMTTELLKRWKSEAQRVGAQAPEQSDAMLRVTTQGIQFPGLKLLSVATIGAKLVEAGDEKDDMPTYEFTLVKDEIKGEGPRPIRFIFNKLTAGRDDKEQTTHSLTKTTAELKEDGIAFTSSSCLEVDVSFPSLLLRILPVSKEKAEEQGSASILKTIERDSGPALENFKQAYLKFIR